MPGHYERPACRADLPYENSSAWINQRRFAQTDVALVIGANDVTNPAARTESQQPHLWHAIRRG